MYISNRILTHRVIDTSMCNNGTKATRVFLPADREACWSLVAKLVSILSDSTGTREHLTLYLQGDRSGMRKQKMTSIKLKQSNQQHSSP